MTFVDYYKVLGISKTATDKEVKQAYRKLARKHHPDLNPNDKNAQQKFQEINEANEVLSDIDNRKKYDKYGKDWKHGEEFEKASREQQSQRNANSQNQQESFSEHDFSDYFQSMFGGSGRSSRQESRAFKGQDFNAELHLELKDV